MIGLFVQVFSIVSLTTATKQQQQQQIFSKFFSQSSLNDSPLGKILPGEMENRETVKGGKIKHECTVTEHKSCHAQLPHLLHLSQIQII